MKKNIKHADYKGNIITTKEGGWWSWIETCDKCGQVIKSHETRTTKKPEMDEADFCLDCLRELMDAGIPYEEAYKKYKGGENNESH